MAVTLDPVTHKNLLALRAKEVAVDKELKKAEALGLDVSEHRAQFEEAKKIRKVLLENYAPSGMSLPEE
jgi:hypothetical protein